MPKSEVAVLMARTWNHKRGPVPKLTEEQQAYIYELICKLPPWRYKLKDQLWDRENVLRLVKGRCGIELSKRTVEAYLRQWGFTLAAPPSARCTTAIQSWLTMNFADTQRQAADDGAPIYWLNAPITLDSSKWRQKGATQSNDSGIDQEQARLLEYVESLSGVPLMNALNSPLRRTRHVHSAGTTARTHKMVSVVTGESQLRWRVIDSDFTFERKQKFLNAIVEDSRRAKLFLIRPNWTTYPCDEDGALQAACEDRIRIFPEGRDDIPETG